MRTLGVGLDVTKTNGVSSPLALLRAWRSLVCLDSVLHWVVESLPGMTRRRGVVIILAHSAGYSNARLQEIILDNASLGRGHHMALCDSGETKV